MKQILLSLTVILLSTPLFSQEEIVYRKLATQEVEARMKLENPAMIEEKSMLERFVHDQKNKIEFKKITIPVVFHVLYNPGSFYIAPEQVLSQINALNSDFSMNSALVQNPEGVVEEFAQKAQDTEISFCFAGRNPSGLPTTGIQSLSTQVASWRTDDSFKHAENGGIAAWDTKRYLNIWVVSLADNFSGYAQMPGGPAETDGIVIDYRFFGNSGLSNAAFNEGRTLTHLIGNYLGLYDLWGEFPCSDDYVEDTPIHNAPNSECYPQQHVSTCDGNPVEMTMNFMDNSPDACAYLFTMGQKIRMQTFLSEGGPRSGLAETGATQCDAVQQQGFSLTAPATGSNTAEEQVFSLRAFPNPATENIQLEVLSSDAGIADLNITTLTGSLITREQIELDKGVRSFDINCRAWPGGIYVIRLKFQNKLIVQKIEVIR